MFRHSLRGSAASDRQVAANDGNNGHASHVGAGHSEARSNKDYWETDVSDDMNFWLRQSPRQSPQVRRHDRELSPIFGGNWKKKHKRLSKNLDEKRVSFPECPVPTFVSDSTFKTVSNYDRDHSQKSRSVDTKLSEMKIKYKYGKMHSPISDRTLTDRSVASTQASILDEIEFQKRYRKVHDLNNHIHFVHSNLLKGRRFNRRTKLPPLASHHVRSKQSEEDDSFDLYVIKSVQRYNQPRQSPIEDPVSKLEDFPASSVRNTEALRNTDIPSEVPKYTPASEPRKTDSCASSPAMTDAESDPSYHLFDNPPLGVRGHVINKYETGRVFMTDTHTIEELKESQFTKTFDKNSTSENNYVQSSSDFGKDETPISVHIEYKRKIDNSPVTDGSGER